MFFNEWNILVVDDEPDILAVTRLALRNVTVYGLPIRIYTAGSKAEALELLRGPLLVHGASKPIVAVALVDVVMETDRAGLELCKFIRGEGGGNSTQLYIRTGQPGVAPERSVIDDYDISGYFTKAELSEQKLYTLVKSGVRQWFTSWYALRSEDLLNNLIVNSGSRKEFLEKGIGRSAEPVQQEDEGVTGFMFDKKLLVSDHPNDIKPLHDRLDVLNPIIQTPEGHKLAMDEMGNYLVKTVKTHTTADYYYVAESTMVMPKLLLDITFKSGLNFSTLWKKITDGEKKAVMTKKDASPSLKKRAKLAKTIAANKPAKKAIKSLVTKPVKKVVIKSSKKR